MKTIYNMNKGLLILSILFLPAILKAQITFEKVYPAATHQSAKDILQTADGGFIMAASIETNNGTDLDILIVRTNDLGDTLWTKTYGGNLPEVPSGILATNDGNYFIVGFKVKAVSLEFDTYLLKLSPSGDTLFSKTYGGYGNEEGKEIIATLDGNYMIVGATNSTNIADNNMELTKVDPNGNVLWNKEYGGDAYESARSVKQCNDGGYIIAGKTVDSLSFSKIFLVRIDHDGDTLWTKTYSNGNSLQGKSILVNSDGSYTLAVDDSSAASESDVSIIKFDSFGNLIWSKKYGGTEKDICKMMQHTPDGGYILASVARSFGWINPEMWLLRCDANGDTLWTKHFGTIDHEHCYAARPAIDGGFIAIGHTRGYNPSRIEQIMFLKLNANGEYGSLESLFQNSVAEATSNVFPNPSNGQFTINIPQINHNFTTKNVEIMNAYGQIVYAGVVNDINTTIDLTSQSKGLYLVSLMEGTKILSSNKIMVTF